MITSNTKGNDNTFEMVNGEWYKIINRFQNMITYNHASIHSYLATAEIGNINR